jgi:hypothetical protein
MQARVLEQVGGAVVPLAGAEDQFASMTNVGLAVVIFAVVAYLLIVKRNLGAKSLVGKIGVLVVSGVVAWVGWFVLSLISNAGVVSLTNILLVLGLLGTLTYFFFSMKHKGVLGGLARVGIIFLMVGFGASFGYTVMSRISLLIGRVSFLLHDWLHLID